jgi:hypothetical protein
LSVPAKRNRKSILKKAGPVVVVHTHSFFTDEFNPYKGLGDSDLAQIGMIGAEALKADFPCHEGTR